VARKIRVTIDLDKDDFDTLHSLREQVMKDRELAIFTMNCTTKQTWYRFVMVMGLSAVIAEFEKQKAGVNTKN